MSYKNVLDGLQEALETLPNLVAVLQYEPPAINDTPLVYLLLDGAELEHAAQVVTTIYRVTVRLLVRWQENDQAELEIIPYVDDLVDAIRADPHLGTKLPRGGAWVSEIEGAFVDVGGVTYRAIDFTVRIKEVR